jgi:hypothetical protein
MKANKLEPKQIYIPSDEEDAILTVAAMSDEDNPPLTDEQLAQMRPASEVLPPHFFVKRKTPHSREAVGY